MVRLAVEYGVCAEAARSISIAVATVEIVTENGKNPFIGRRAMKLSR